jgi:hypothetical protein
VTPAARLQLIANGALPAAVRTPRSVGRRPQGPAPCHRARRPRT